MELGDNLDHKINQIHHIIILLQEHMPSYIRTKTLQVTWENKIVFIKPASCGYLFDPQNLAHELPKLQTGSPTKGSYTHSLVTTNY